MVSVGFMTRLSVVVTDLSNDIAKSNHRQRFISVMGCRRNDRDGPLSLAPMTTFGLLWLSRWRLKARQIWTSMQRFKRDYALAFEIQATSIRANSANCRAIDPDRAYWLLLAFMPKLGLKLSKVVQ